MAKGVAALRAELAVDKVARIMELARDPAKLEAMPIDQFMNLYRL